MAKNEWSRHVFASLLKRAKGRSICRNTAVSPLHGMNDTKKAIAVIPSAAGSGGGDMSERRQPEKGSSLLHARLHPFTLKRFNESPPL
ncbi:MAG TPA: hypothetical protein VJ453_04680 [Terriglobales bacterium]|nr:hypothetical protein [Terriglobales bacterium]